MNLNDTEVTLRVVFVKLNRKSFKITHYWELNNTLDVVHLKP